MKLKFLSGNALKILASVFMLLDHIGFLLLPSVGWLRIIGRLAFPIYAFMIAEGCFYTKNKLKYFLQIFVLGAICQAAYFIYNGDTYMCILITFSLSVLIIYSLDYLKKQVLAKKWPKAVLALGLLATAVAGAFVFTRIFRVDYGFTGVLIPVMASFFNNPNEKKPKQLASVAMLGLGLIFLAWRVGGVQIYSILAILLLLLYSGKRGKLNLKYYFYIFYPLHLLALEGLSLII